MADINKFLNGWSLTSSELIRASNYICKSDPHITVIMLENLVACMLNRDIIVDGKQKKLSYDTDYCYYCNGTCMRYIMRLDGSSYVRCNDSYTIVPHNINILYDTLDTIGNHRCNNIRMLFSAFVKPQKKYYAPILTRDQIFAIERL